jgi:hypothetical protein
MPHIRPVSDLRNNFVYLYELAEALKNNEKRIGD